MTLQRQLLRKIIITLSFFILYYPYLCRFNSDIRPVAFCHILSRTNDFIATTVSKNCDYAQLSSLYHFHYVQINSKIRPVAFGSILTRTNDLITITVLKNRDYVEPSSLYHFYFVRNNSEILREMRLF